MEVIIGKSDQIIEKAQAIRYQVFTVEQKIPNKLDFDGLDSSSEHVLVMNENQPVATARLTIDTDGSSVMARVAVLEAYRGHGIASVVVKALIGHATSQSVSSIEIHAHGYLRSYYEKFGFAFIKEVEVVGEHQLIEMRYQIVRT
ncbi:GNAT family N-acetyltransferase [Vibrio gallaecicus]|uniref:GNAT family N-acetyltransferase n=1 Tax=Vibrio gallaecicus TaxID=552386 RepID=A0ABV4NGS8_9VIBR